MHAAELQRGLATLDPRVHAALGAVIDREGAKATAHMRTHAPWTDRTGHARSSLGHRVVRIGTGWALILFGGASYQVYLETKYSGRDAIITPTILLWGLRTMAATNRLLDRLGGAP